MGRPFLFVDETGVIRHSYTGPATANDLSIDPDRDPNPREPTPAEKRVLARLRLERTMSSLDYDGYTIRIPILAAALLIGAWVLRIRRRPREESGTRRTRVVLFLAGLLLIGLGTCCTLAALGENNFFTRLFDDSRLNDFGSRGGLHGILLTLLGFMLYVFARSSKRLQFGLRHLVLICMFLSTSIGACTWWGFRPRSGWHLFPSTGNGGGVAYRIFDESPLWGRQPLLLIYDDRGRPGAGEQDDIFFNTKPPSPDNPNVVTYVAGIHPSQPLSKGSIEIRKNLVIVRHDGTVLQAELSGRDMAMIKDRWCSREEYLDLARRLADQVR